MQNFDFLSIWPLTPSHVDANCGVEQRHEDQVLVDQAKKLSGSGQKARKNQIYVDSTKNLEITIVQNIFNR